MLTSLSEFTKYPVKTQTELLKLNSYDYYCTWGLKSDCTKSNYVHFLVMCISENKRKLLENAC